MTIPFRIAIIGAGPAGCTLAKLLLVSSVAEKLNIVIFEGEASLEARTQGGTLDLHTKTGIAALKRAGLYDGFAKCARYDAEAFTLCNQDLKRFVCFSGTAGDKNSRGRPEIDRIQLRELLLDSLPDGLVKWNHRIQRITTDTSGKPTLHFEHGSETDFDLVIGADGAWSKVRPLLSEQKPYFSGVSGYSFKIDDAENRQPEAWKLVNRGSLFSWGCGGRALMAQQLATKRAVAVATWAVTSEDSIRNEKFDTRDAKATTAALLERYHDFHPSLKRLLEVVDDDLVMQRNLYMLPIGHRWQHKPYLTLLGDSAHLMTPFAGEGVNLAMADAMNLADHIITAAESVATTTLSPEACIAVLSEQVRIFEEDMYIRAAKVQQMTKDMMDSMFFTMGAPEATVDRYVYTAASDMVPLGLRWLLNVCVKAYFSYWRRLNL